MDDSTSAKDDHQPVTTEKGVTEIIVATVDALEALCHYNPAALTRLAQSGGVHALLNVLYPYYIPSMVRAAVLDVMSLLLQEVAPFRRMRPHEDNGGDIHNIFQQSIQQLSSTVYTCEGEDRLLQAMTLQALTGAYGSDGPPPYSMDRASASKFDSSAREWFSRKGLSHLVTSIMQLRTTKLMSPLDAEDGAGSRQRVTWLWEKRVKDLLVAIDEKSKKQ
ncbi:hypothetical protein AGDE_13862 [Angomonas deanei]|nr:hypothetical protein AGDE_13862 [Angomonas deanei]|eukprot:EPY21690.1 hypothetical protein AGDE_13862 [Angomonas deanei]